MRTMHELTHTTTRRCVLFMVM